MSFLLVNSFKLVSNNLRRVSTIFAPVKSIIWTPQKCFSNKILDVNTNVIKDVIMYQHENSKLIKILSGFSVAQYTFWAYMSYVSYTSLKDVPVDLAKLKPNAPWYMKLNLGETKYRYGISMSCGFIALATLATSWGFTVRLVRFLILHKGGTHVSFVTYSPVGPNRITKVPINEISCLQARSSSKGFIPVRVKQLRMNFLLDSKGNFRNPLLYDSTVGLKRNLK